MSREEIQKLLGGYATGTLTTAEQQALFEAALEDQQLFDQLAQEQALRDLLHEPEAKAQVLEALDQPRRSWFVRPRAWWPAAATLAVACTALVVMFAVRRQQDKPVAVATYRPLPAARPSPSTETPVAPPAAPPAQTSASAREIREQREEKIAPAKPRPIEPARRDEPKVAAEAQAEDADQKLKKEVAANAPAAPGPAAAVGTGNAAGAVAPPRLTASDVREAFSLAAPNSIQVNEQDQTVQVNNGAAQTAQALFYNTPPAAMQFKAAADQGAGARLQQEPAPMQQQASQMRQQTLRSQVQQAYTPMVFPGFKYRIMRQAPAGEFLEAAADKLNTGDTLRLAFTLNVSGRLEVKAGGKTLIARDAAAGSQYNTAVLQPGTTEITVDFLPKGLPPVAVKRVAATRAVNVVERKSEETYVVGVPPTDRVHFTIQLQYQ